jgi:hypothetical protein
MGYHEGHMALELCTIFIIIPLSVFTVGLYLVGLR